jgi:hypothetical protein
MIHKEPEKPSVAYQKGWFDGRHGGRGSFTDNPNLAEWEGASDRIAYYLGHREGREARDRADGGPRPGAARGESAAPPA